MRILKIVVAVIALTLLTFFCVKASFAQSAVPGQGPIYPMASGHDTNVGFGGLLTVSQTLNFACTQNAGYGRVIIQQGAVASDAPTIGGMTTYTVSSSGCSTNMTIVDLRGASGSSCYSYTNSTTFTQGQCTAAGSLPSTSGFPITIGNTAIAAASTNTAVDHLSVNTVINVTGTLNAAITTCGSNPTTLQITTGVTLSTSVTVPKNCTIKRESGGELLPTTGQVITFAAGSQIVDNSFGSPLFGGLGTVTGLANIWLGTSYPEWFCSIVYGGSGDNSACINAAITATGGGTVRFQAQAYGVTSPITVTTNNTSLVGAGPGRIGTGNTVIQSNSATADIIDLVGGTPSAPGCTSEIVSNQIFNLTVLRSVAASGSAKGISLVCTQLDYINNVDSYDSISNIYLNASPNTILTNVSGNWLKSYTTTTVTGLNVDSENGSGSFSLYGDNVTMDCPGGFFPNQCRGADIHGQVPGDLWLKGFQSANAGYGIHLAYDGTCSTQDDADIELDNPILTEDGIPGSVGAAIYITGFSCSQFGPAISVNGGIVQTFNGPTIDIESSSAGVQIGGGIKIQVGANATQGVIANSSSNVNLTSAQIQSNNSFDAVKFATCNSCSVQNVSVQGVTSVGGTPATAIHLTTSTGGMYGSDRFDGVVGTAAIIADSTSGGTGNNFGPFQNNTGSPLYSGTAGITSLQQMNATNIIDSGLTTGTAAVCPNGAGGLLVNTGCVTGSVANALTGAASGGASPGSTYTGAAAVTFDFHTLGAAPTNLGMTTLGDTVYGGASGATTRLAGPTTTAHVFAFGDIPVSSLAVAPAWYDMTANMPFLASNNNFTNQNTIDTGASTNIELILKSSSNFGSELDLQGTGTGVHHWAINSGGSGDKAGALLFPDLTVGIYGWGMNVTNNTGLGFQEVPSLMVFSWSSTSDIKTTPPDTGISRCGAANLCVGNGTQNDSSGTVTTAHLIGGTDIKDSGLLSVPCVSTSTVGLLQSGCTIGISNPITSATGGTGTGTVTCVSATCTNLRGTYSVAGGTFTTGNFLALVWPTTTTGYVCTATMNGGTGFLGIGNDVATATGMNISAGVTILGVTVIFNYSCQP